MKWKGLLLLLGYNVLAVHVLDAQQPSARQRASVLYDYVQQGLQHNAGLTQQRIEADRQHIELESARGQYLPRLQFRADYTLAEGGRTIDFPVGDLLNPVYNRLNQLQEADPFPQIENVSEQFLPHDFHETKLRLVQPVYQPPLYRKENLKESALQLERSRVSDRMASLSYEIRMAYLRHMQARDALEIYRNSRGVVQANLRLNQSLYENGKATRDAVLDARYEVQQLKGDLAEAQKQLATSRAAFNQLLGRDTETSIVPQELQLAPRDTNRALSFFKEVAGEQRPELRTTQRLVAVKEAARQLQQSRMLPTLQAVGDLGYQGFGYTFDEPQQFYLVNVSLQWDLYHGQRRRRAIERARLGRRQAEVRAEEVRQQVMVAVTRRYYAWKAAWRRLQAARVAEESARQSYRMAESRYAAQDMLWVSYQRAQNRWIQAQLQRNIRRYEVHQAQAALDRATGNDPYLR